jgi:hypothetical protein
MIALSFFTRLSAYPITIGITLHLSSQFESLPFQSHVVSKELQHSTALLGPVSQVSQML